jgi:hypothetical protein
LIFLSFLFTGIFFSFFTIHFSIYIYVSSSENAFQRQQIYKTKQEEKSDFFYFLKWQNYKIKRKPRSQDQNSQFVAPMFKSHVQRKFIRGKAIDELFECSFV